MLYKGKHIQQKKPAYAAAQEEKPAPPASPRPEKKPHMSRGRRAVIIVCAVLVFFGSLYGLFVFSNNAFIKKWRTIYIETAMSTMTHQWLATAFIPGYIIDEVVTDAAQQNEGQKNLLSKWWGSVDEDDEQRDYSDEREAFYGLFWELDEDSFEAYLEKNPELLIDGYGGIVLDNLDCSDKTIVTKFGEIVRALSAPDGVLVMRVTGDEYVGTLACVKDPAQVTMEKAAAFGAFGEQVESYCEGNVLAMNASGFTDTDGTGNGDEILGSLVLDGVEYGTPTGDLMYFGFKTDDRLYLSWDIDKSEYKWAMQFNPALVVNGQSQVRGSYGWGLQPRTAIGQTKSGEFLMLVIDGRQVGYSLGATVEDCANIMVLHEAYQAANLDGGSSSVMAYQGEIITRNSSQNSDGRYLPNAVVVTHPQ